MGYQKDAVADGNVGDRSVEAGGSECGQGDWYFGPSIRTVDGNAFYVRLRKRYILYRFIVLREIRIRLFHTFSYI